MQKHRERSRGSAKFAVKHDLGAEDWIEKTEGDDSKFVGYEKNDAQAKLRKYQIDGDKIKLILDQTPFYAESGGQVGDVGEIIGDGWKAIIEDTLKESDSFVHMGTIQGEIGESADVIARIDIGRRDAIRRNHTATHLLHFALRKVLGDHVHQSGSHVAPDRFRFDYTHFEAPSKAQLRKIERIVNEVAMADIPVCSRKMAYREALDKGAIALFGEKYGDSVRVISIEAVSQELCGGTHLTRTGEMGAFLIRSEGSVGSGQRRIEAITGGGVLEWINILRENQNEIAGILKVGQGEDLVEKTRAIIAERKELEDIIEDLRREQTGDTAELLVEKASTYPKGRFIVEEVKVNDREQLANLVDELKDKLASGAVFLVSEIEGKIALISGVTPDLIEIGVHAGDLIKG
ncbi:MAG: alanine--tRNA ligase-related protein, partial [bacterium]